MGIIELIILAAGLAMDAFAVSICKGLAMGKITLKNCAVCGLWFGGFQTLMPLAGYLLSSSIEKYVEAYAPWIAFCLLAFIGVNMMRSALSRQEQPASAAMDAKTMFFMAVATSIDAFAVGVTFACVPVQLIPGAGGLANTAAGAAIIGLITFGLAFFGVKAGSVFGTRYKEKAKLAGGLVLVLIGFKILLVH